MNRLTTNKPVSEMGMLELAYNSCIKKNGELVYRDFEKEVSARDFIRKVWSTYYGSPLPDDDDSLDYELMEMLSENPIDSAAGLIALLYRFMWTNADLRGELKHYEDLAEQGKLLELKYKPGTPAYRIEKYSIGQEWVHTGYDHMGELGYYRNIDRYQIKNIQITLHNMDEVGRNIFLTEAEAKKEKEKRESWEG